MSVRPPWYVLLLAAFVIFLVVLGLLRTDAGAAEFFRIFAIPVALLTGAIVAAWWQRLRQRPLGEGYAALHRGQLAAALEKFERHARRDPRDPNGLYYRGVARMQLWQLKAAAGDLEEAWQRAGNPSDWHPAAPALCHALLGNADRAAQWLTRLPADDAFPAETALARAVLLARSAEWASARERLAMLEAKRLGGPLGALARALDSWWVERLTGELRHVDRVALFGEAGPEELRSAWPGFVEFVERAPAW